MITITEKTEIILPSLGVGEGGQYSLLNRPCGLQQVSPDRQPIIVWREKMGEGRDKLLWQVQAIVRQFNGVPDSRRSLVLV